MAMVSTPDLDPRPSGAGEPDAMDKRDLSGEDEWAWVDEAQAPFHAFVDSLSVANEPMVNEATGEGLLVESLRVSLSFELDVSVGDDGRMRLAGSPPTQHTETTVMPVFHQLSLNVTTLDSEVEAIAGYLPESSTSDISVASDG